MDNEEADGEVDLIEEIDNLMSGEGTKEDSEDKKVPSTFNVDICTQINEIILHMQSLFYKVANFYL